ncbi:MAG: Fic family protein [Brevundimonas sp.]|nr:Fic family protein [Brevundimonas sp.]MCA3718729.1 Fic family protein [Brevundimonas sp.]
MIDPLPELADWSARLAGSRVLGLEQRLVHVLRPTAGPIFLHVAAQVPVLKAYFRPAPEPVLASFWPLFVNGHLSDVLLDGLASALLGAPARRRKGDCWSKPGPAGDAVQYPKPETIPEWSQRLRATATLQVHPLMVASVVFADTLLTHPFEDGNGRLARALFQGVLANIADLKAPVLPLAPVFHADLLRTNLALRHLSRTGDWSAFADAMTDAVHATLRLLERAEAG